MSRRRRTPRGAALAPSPGAAGAPRVATRALVLAPLADRRARSTWRAASHVDGTAGRGGSGLPMRVHTPPVPTSRRGATRPAVPGVPTWPASTPFHVLLPQAAARRARCSTSTAARCCGGARPLRVLPIASLTKIMTALVVVERTRPDDPVRITQAALDYTGSGIGLLPKGRRVRAEALLNGLLIVSGNDAAIALAVHVAGNERRFVALMNRRRARQWASTCTRFASSHGLEPGNRSCARDLAVLTRLAMREAAHPPRRPQAPGADALPDQGRQALPLRPQPADAARLPGHHRAQDRLHRRGRPLLRRAWRAAATRRLGVVLLDSRDPAKQAPKLLDAAGFRRRSRQSTSEPIAASAFSALRRPS